MNATINHSPLSMQRYQFNNSYNLNWKTEYNELEHLLYFMPQMIITTSQKTKLFIHLKCENERVCGVLFKGEDRIIMSSNSNNSRIKEMDAILSENVCEVDLEEGKYTFIPYLIKNNKNCSINVLLESPIKLSVIVSSCKDRFIKFNLEEKEVKDRGNDRIEGVYTQIPQYKLTLKKVTTLLFKSNDKFSYYIYVFDSNGNNVLSENQYKNIANFDSIYSYCANLQPGQYSIVLH